MMRIFLATLVLFACCCVAAASAANPYTVIVASAKTIPVVSGNSYLPGSSIFAYSYNPAAWKNSQNQTCLMVRNQNRNAGHNDPLGPVSASKLAISCRDSPSSPFSPITNASVVFQPTGPFDVLGTEDPRILELNGRLFMFYTAVSKNRRGGATARLSMATCPVGEAHNAKSWRQHGQLFPDDPNGFQFTKSGALLKSDNGKPLLIFGDSTIVPGLQVAIPNAWPPTSWSVPADFLLFKTREHSFDSELVEAGPPPMKLASGDWLFLYNSAQRLEGVPNRLLYNFGYVILNGSNPTQVLQRSDKPLMQPTRIWQTQGLTPFVVFVEGMVPAAAQSGDDPSKSARFTIFYGAGDTNVGEAEILVTW